MILSLSTIGFQVSYFSLFCLINVNVKCLVTGFFNLIIAALIIWLMDYYKCPINFILEIVTKKTVPHIVASVLYTSIFSIILF